MPSTTANFIDLSRAATVYRNLSIEELVQHCLERDDCQLTASGAVVAYSGKYTGRTPKDKYIVRDALTENRVWWDNNNAMSPEDFGRVSEKIANYLVERPLYVVDTFAGADPNFRIAVRFIVERPYHAMFMRQLLIRPTAEELQDFNPEWTVMDACRLSMDPATDPVRSDAVIALNLSAKQVAIAGTQYAGELKKSVFTIMNFLLPLHGVLSMHCSANVGEATGDTALFFGLSGTGKTTLSADPERLLIGDDEHGWTNDGVFNIEGGCYAKCIGLSEAGEPEIFHAICPGSILENVVLREDGEPDYESDRLTENTRVAYPLDHIPHAVQPSLGGHPANVVFLTADALGLLPPIARLTPEQAMFYFINGYTAKVAGTEAGVKEPSVVFSACFGQPFLPLPPREYAELLRKKILAHQCRVWLVNTGWTGGPYGVGTRMKLSHTRAMLHDAFEGLLDNVPYRIDPVFGLHVPTSVAGVPSEILDPRGTWSNPDEYDAKAHDLKARFEANALKFA